MEALSYLFFFGVSVFLVYRLFTTPDKRNLSTKNEVVKAGIAALANHYSKKRNHDDCG